MKKRIALMSLLAVTSVAACLEDRPRSGSDDDDGGANGGAGADTTATGGSGGESAGSGGTMEHPLGPQFLELGTNVSTLYDGESVIFTAVLTDPDGVEDVLGGSLKHADGSLYGTFDSGGQPGSYQMQVDWYAINQVASIDFAYGASQARGFIAEFWDSKGHVSTKEVNVALACSSGYAGCDGSCIDTMNDVYACGSCDKSCYDDLCVVDSFCQAGQCVGEENTCEWLDDQCTVGQCNPATGDCSEQTAPNGTACDDGDPCTSDDVCTAGLCAGTAAVGGTLFDEDFSDNTAGWTLGTEWGIGPATTSTGHESYNPDPANDFTATADDGVAGVVIGGNASKAATHAYYYLTSPAVDVAAVSGDVTLEFRRWLNSDYTPYMQNVVEVWNGTAWVAIWESAGTAISDASWQLISYDLTPYKNAALKVRFGHALVSTSAYTVSSWNLDDVKIKSDTVCGG